MTGVASRSDGLAYRPVRPDELSACVEIWRESINDYIGRLGQPEIASETSPLLRLYGHLSATDPDRFIVATEVAARTGEERIVGFASALVRERLWFLSMLFVSPHVQAAGVGRALLARVMPEPSAGMSMATATDSAQPISNALYSSYGIVPRIPLLNLIGRPERAEAFEPLPSGVSAIPFESIAGGPPGGAGHQELADTVDAIDRECWGSPTRSITATCARSRDTAGYTVAPTARRSDTAMRPRRGESGRWRSARRRSWSRSLAI